MGGYGSGRWGWHSKADTVEDCRSLDIRMLARDNAFHPWKSGTVTWTRGKRQISAIGYTVRPVNDSDLSLVLNYTWTPNGKGTAEEIEIPIVLETTRPHLGGVRWWCRCPLVVGGRDCNRRVAKLYLPPGGRYFGCRHCYRLTYQSAQQHDKRIDWLRKNPELIGELLDGGHAALSDRMMMLAMKAMESLDR